MTFKLLIRIVAAVSLAGPMVLSAFSYAAANGNPIRIGTTPTGHLMWIAEHQGYFAARGVAVEVKEYSSGVTASQALFKGEADLVNSSEFAFVSNAMTNADIRIVASIARANSANLFTRADRGIATVDDLVGRRVGVTRRSIGEFFLGEYLAINGLSISEVSLVDLRAPDIVAAITAGNVDAAITWEPFVYRAKEQLGEAFRVLPDQENTYYHFVLAGFRTWISARRNQVTALLQALIDAEKYASDEPAAAQAIIAERFDLDPGFVRETWSRYILEVTLQQTLISLMEQEARWRLDNGLDGINNTPDFLRLIDSEPLETASPHAVQLIR